MRRDRSGVSGGAVIKVNCLKFVKPETETIDN